MTSPAKPNASVTSWVISPQAEPFTVPWWHLIAEADGSVQDRSVDGVVNT